jgi:hypothetical protein
VNGFHAGSLTPEKTAQSPNLAHKPVSAIAQTLSIVGSILNGVTSENYTGVVK